MGYFDWAFLFIAKERAQLLWLSVCTYRMGHGLIVGTKEPLILQCIAEEEIDNYREQWELSVRFTLEV